MRAYIDVALSSQNKEIKSNEPNQIYILSVSICTLRLVVFQIGTESRTKNGTSLFMTKNGMQSQQIVAITNMIEGIQFRFRYAFPRARVFPIEYALDPFALMQKNFYFFAFFFGEFVFVLFIHYVIE